MVYFLFVDLEIMFQLGKMFSSCAGNKMRNYFPIVKHIFLYNFCLFTVFISCDNKDYSVENNNITIHDFIKVYLLMHQKSHIAENIGCVVESMVV